MIFYFTLNRVSITKVIQLTLFTVSVDNMNQQLTFTHKVHLNRFNLTINSSHCTTHCESVGVHDRRGTD